MLAIRNAVSLQSLSQNDYPVGLALADSLFSAARNARNG